MSKCFLFSLYFFLLGVFTEPRAFWEEEEEGEEGEEEEDEEEEEEFCLRKFLQGQRLTVVGSFGRRSFAASFITRAFAWRGSDGEGFCIEKAFAGRRALEGGFLQRELYNEGYCVESF